MRRDFFLRTPAALLHGRLWLPPAQRTLVLVPQLQALGDDEEAPAAAFLAAGHGILALPLLTPREAHSPDAMHNVALLAQRLLDALDAVRDDGDTAKLALGLLAGGHLTPAAIRAAARRDLQVRALVCHGGLLDLAGRQYLELLAAPLLVLTDAGDEAAERSCERAAAHLHGPLRTLRLQPGEAPDGPAGEWFGRHLAAV